MELHFDALATDGVDIGLEHHSLSNKDAQKITATWVGVGDLAVGPDDTPAPAPAPPPSSPPPSSPPSSPSTSAADMGVTNLVVHPSQAEPGEKVSIEVDIFNKGPSEGSYEVVLMINGAKETTKDVTLASGESTTVTLLSSKQTEGSYLVDVNGLTREFIVRTTILPGSPSSSESSAEESTGPAAPPLPLSPSSSPINWPVLGGIISGVMVVVAAVVIYLVRRRAY